MREIVAELTEAAKHSEGASSSGLSAIEHARYKGGREVFLVGEQLSITGATEQH
jgi:hypothetical protein